MGMSASDSVLRSDESWGWNSVMTDPMRPAFPGRALQCRRPSWLELRDIDPASLNVPDTAGRWDLGACFDVKVSHSRLQGAVARPV